MITVGVDTGRKTGWAVAHGTRIVDCGLVLVDDCHAVRLPRVYGGQVVIEVPDRIDPHVDPRDIITLALRAGRAVEYYLGRGNAVRTITPVSWKGSVPKHIHEARIRSALSEHEAATVAERMKAIPDGFRNNTWDAVGITLWAVGRDSNRKDGTK